MKKSILVTIAVMLIAVICYILYISGKAEGGAAKQDLIENGAEQ